MAQRGTRVNHGHLRRRGRWKSRRNSIPSGWSLHVIDVPLPRLEVVNFDSGGPLRNRRRLIVGGHGVVWQGVSDCRILLDHLRSSLHRHVIRDLHGNGDALLKRRLSRRLLPFHDIDSGLLLGIGR